MKKLYCSNVVICTIYLMMMICMSCKRSFLDETPLSSLSNENVLTSKEGFLKYIASLHRQAREELSNEDLTWYFDNWTGTDVATSGQISVTQFVNYETYLTPSSHAAKVYWHWAYADVLPLANTIIEYAENDGLSDIWTEEEKNRIIGEAKFFRAYTYNILATYYGGVPIVDHVEATPKVDYTRATRQEVYEFAAKDLEFAAKWLPPTVPQSQEGRIVSDAANHLLTEVYISLGKYDSAVASASKVIDGGVHHLMKQRFGVNKNKPGDVFSDLFIQGNQNRSDGNMESIWVWQFESFVPGGRGTLKKGNHMIRGWYPFLDKLKDPKGKKAIQINDTIGRGVAIIRPNSHYLYDIWSGAWGNDFYKDMRNSKYNMKRDYYYNDPKSSYFGQKIEPRTSNTDTMERIYPTTRKVEGQAWEGDVKVGGTSKDRIVYRLGETYLLRAEAYFRKGELKLAADDINVIRERAEASAISESDLSIDFILDERSRELIAEEPRRRTLMRMGKLVERVKKYNIKEVTRNSITDRNELFPIPLDAIDANFGHKLEQNPDYF